MKLLNPSHHISIKFLILTVGILDISMIIGGFATNAALAFALSLIANGAWAFYLDQIGYIQFFRSNNNEKQ